MNTLVIDIGGTNVKVWKTGENDSKKFPSGKKLTPRRFMDKIHAMTAKVRFDRVSIGYPGEVRNGRLIAEPWNLGPGWLDFDWSSAFPCPMQIMNDACMQALGSYSGDRMLYLGLGTSIGTVFITDGTIVPLALGHLTFREGKDFDHFLGRKGLKLYSKKAWRQRVFQAGETLKAAFHADYVVFGGGNAKTLGTLPEGFLMGGNHNAYFGGLRMWEGAQEQKATDGRR